MGIITYSHAKTLKLNGWKVKQCVQVASKPWEIWETKVYLVPLVDKSGSALVQTPLLPSWRKFSLIVLCIIFPNILNVQQLASPHGQVQLLIGLNKL